LSCEFTKSDSPIDFVSSYPTKGQTQVRVFGRYWIVFSDPVSYSSDDRVTASFGARVFASAETLYVQPKAVLPFSTLEKAVVETLTIETLTRPGGGKLEFDIAIQFTTVFGEVEPNNEPTLADTLFPGDLVHGVTGVGGGAVSDVDFFRVIPVNNDSFTVKVSLLDTLSLFCNGGTLGFVDLKKRAHQFFFKRYPCFSGG